MIRTQTEARKLPYARRRRDNGNRWAYAALLGFCVQLAALVAATYAGAAVKDLKYLVSLAVLGLASSALAILLIVAYTRHGLWSHRFSLLTLVAFALVLIVFLQCYIMMLVDIYAARSHFVTSQPTTPLVSPL